MCDDTLVEFTCNVRDVIKVIIKLKTNSSSGADGLSGYFLKYTVTNIAGPLCKLSQISMSEGNIPGHSKSAFVVPLHKKGDVRCSGDYRPVSLTSAIRIKDTWTNYSVSVIRPHVEELCYHDYSKQPTWVCTKKV